MEIDCPVQCRLSDSFKDTPLVRLYFLSYQIDIKGPAGFFVATGASLIGSLIYSSKDSAESTPGFALQPLYFQENL